MYRKFQYPNYCSSFPHSWSSFRICTRMFWSVNLEIGSFNFSACNLQLRSKNTPLHLVNGNLKDINGLVLPCFSRKTNWRASSILIKLRIFFTFNLLPYCQIILINDIHKFMPNINHLNDMQVKKRSQFHKMCLWPILTQNLISSINRERQVKHKTSFQTFYAFYFYWIQYSWLGSFRKELIFSSIGLW